MQIFLGRTEHEIIKAQQREKYSDIFWTLEHEIIKEKQRDEYADIFVTPEHKIIKWRKRDHYSAFSGTTQHDKINKNQNIGFSNDFSNNITKFRKEIIKGPYFICVVCNRSLYL